MKIYGFSEEENYIIPSNDLEANIALTIYNEYRNKISVEFPSPANNQCYILRSNGYVGQIPILDNTLLFIDSKVPVSSIFRMLEYAYNLKSFEFLYGITESNSTNEIFEQLAMVLAKMVIDRKRKGLYQSYVTKTDSLSYVRGRILVRPMLNNSFRGLVKVDCEYDEHTVDVVDNQILVWTLYRISHLNIIREDVRKQIRHAYRALSNIIEIRNVNPQECINRFYHRLNEDYQPMHALCRLFLEHSGPLHDLGDKEFIPFILDMPLLFETFVAEWLKVNLPDNIGIKAQYRAKLDDDGIFAFRIDLVLVEIPSGRVLAVLDTKYKRNTQPIMSDIHEIVSYAVRMGTQNAFLIYPSNVTMSEIIPVGEVCVQSITFDISKDPDESGRLFIEKLKEKLKI